MTTASPEQTLANLILQITTEQKPETVDQLTRLVHDRLSDTSQEKILNVIMHLQDEGKLRLSSQPPLKPNLSGYMRTSQTGWFWITLTCILATVAAAFLISPDAGPLIIVRNILGILFILWFPGYTFIKTLFPTTASSKETPKKDLDIIERVALSIGMSLALVPIVGLLLNYTPWGITLVPVVISLTALTLAFATAALLREYQKRDTGEHAEAEP